MNKRQKAVREYLLGGCTYLQLEKKYGISKATINRCVLKYQAQQQAKLKGVGLSSDLMKPKLNQPPTVEQLQKLLEQEQLRNKLLNTMLDIAEDELQVPIRKKFGRIGGPNQAVEKVRHNGKRQSLSALCALLGYSRQAFYQFEKNNSQACFEAELVIQQVLLHRSLQPRLGTRKLLVLMQGFVQEHQLKMGRDALFDLLREHKLLVKKRRRKVQTTFSNHWQKKYPNLIREYVPKAPNLLWVSDITYILVGDGFAYLSLVTDAYSRKIVGFCVSETLSAMGSLKALSMALKDCPDTSGLIHHSDRGVQYCCLEYVNLLKDNTIQISMTQSGDPLENAIAERVNGILKQELLADHYPSLAVAKKGIAQAVLIYNSLRPHSSCDMMTPQQAHQQTGDLRRRWKNYYKKREVDLEIAS